MKLHPAWASVRLHRLPVEAIGRRPSDLSLSLQAPHCRKKTVQRQMPQVKDRTPPMCRPPCCATISNRPPARDARLWKLHTKDAGQQCVPTSLQAIRQMNSPVLELWHAMLLEDDIEPSVWAHLCSCLLAFESDSRLPKAPCSLRASTPDRQHQANTRTTEAAAVLETSFCTCRLQTPSDETSRNFQPATP